MSGTLDGLRGGLDALRDGDRGRLVAFIFTVGWPPSAPGLAVGLVEAPRARTAMSTTKTTGSSVSHAEGVVAGAAERFGGGRGEDDPGTDLLGGRGPLNQGKRSSRAEAEALGRRPPVACETLRRAVDDDRRATPGRPCATGAPVPAVTTLDSVLVTLSGDLTVTFGAALARSLPLTVTALRRRTGPCVAASSPQALSTSAEARRVAEGRRRGDVTRGEPSGPGAVVQRTTAPHDNGARV